jgi:hypothetical protein
MKDKTLAKAVEASLEFCLAIKGNENILIVSNPGTEQEIIARAMHEAASASGIESRLILQPIKTQTDFAESEVIEAIAEKPCALVSLSHEKLGKDPGMLGHPRTAPDGKSYDHIFHYLLYGTKEIRAFWSPGATVDMFERTVAIDYGAMREKATMLSSWLGMACAANIRSPSGTNLTIGLGGRRPYLDVGDFSAPGMGGNLPAGEVFISPVVKSAQGEMVFDGSIADIAGDIVIEVPIRCHVMDGYVVSVDGGREAERLERALRWGMDKASELVGKNGIAPETALRYATNARHIGEFGIGLNAEARICGNMLEDEKVYGTCHFAIGSNYDEDAPAMIHLDGLVNSPTITLLLEEGQEVVIMRDGSIA